MEARNIQIQRQLKMSNEAKEVLKLLDEMENFTINLRSKILEEIKNNRPSVRLKLNEIGS